MKLTIVIVTGLSGSGKTVALRALEDSGFFCVDNLPVNLISLFISRLAKSKNITKIGIGIDIREKTFLSRVDSVLSELRKKYRTSIVFLEAEKAILIRRFKETRRPHPLSSGANDIEDSLSKELDMLAPLRSIADRIIDTSSYTPHQLRQLIIATYARTSKTRALLVTLMSFGYKFGVPQDVDLLFDIRFLPNPNFVTNLKNLTGSHPSVKKFVFAKPQAKKCLKKLQQLIDFLIPLYMNEGRAYLNIGIGCTGGRHRSPAVVEKFGDYLKKYPVDVQIVHRDI